MCVPGENGGGGGGGGGGAWFALVQRLQWRGSASGDEGERGGCDGMAMLFLSDGHGAADPGFSTWGVW